MASREEMATCLLEMGFSDIEVDCALQATEFKVPIHFLDPASYCPDLFFLLTTILWIRERSLLWSGCLSSPEMQSQMFSP